MQTQNVNFAVTSKNGVVQEIGRSVILQPKLKYKGTAIKWHEDKIKTK